MNNDIPADYADASYDGQCHSNPSDYFEESYEYNEAASRSHEEGWLYAEDD